MSKAFCRKCLQLSLRRTFWWVFSEHHRGNFFPHQPLIGASVSQPVASPGQGGWMVLSGEGDVRSRKAPEDGGWKWSLDAILAFLLPVLETAYRRAKSQVCNEKKKKCGNRKCLNTLFSSRNGVKKAEVPDSVMQEGKEHKALSKKAALQLPKFSSELCLTIPILPVGKLRQGDLLEEDSRWIAWHTGLKSLLKSHKWPRHEEEIFHIEGAESLA